MAKEILKDEIMSDAELDNVAGGFMKAYFFMYANIDNNYFYTKDPITLGATTEPMNFFKDNLKLFADLKEGNLLQVSNTDPSGEFQSFADDNASRWSKPARWGNVVFAVNMLTGTTTRYEA